MPVAAALARGATEHFFPFVVCDLLPCQRVVRPAKLHNALLPVPLLSYELVDLVVEVS